MYYSPYISRCAFLVRCSSFTRSMISSTVLSKSYVVPVEDRGLPSVLSSNRCRSVCSSCRWPCPFSYPLSCLPLPVLTTTFRDVICVILSVVVWCSSLERRFSPTLVFVFLFQSMSINLAYVYRNSAVAYLNSPGDKSRSVRALEAFPGA